MYSLTFRNILQNKNCYRKNIKCFQCLKGHNAIAHASRIHMEARCKIPRPKIIPIGDPSKTYLPHCTVLHRCGDDTGCCHTDLSTCVPKRTATVDLYFYVSYTLCLFLILLFQSRNIIFRIKNGRM